MALGTIELLNGVNGHVLPSVVEEKAVSAVIAEHRPADLDVCGRL